MYGSNNHRSGVPSSQQFSTPMSTSGTFQRGQGTNQNYDDDWGWNKKNPYKPGWPDYNQPGIGIGRPGIGIPRPIIPPGSITIPWRPPVGVQPIKPGFPPIGIPRPPGEFYPAPVRPPVQITDPRDEFFRRILDGRVGFDWPNNPNSGNGQYVASRMPPQSFFEWLSRQQG